MGLPVALWGLLVVVLLVVVVLLLLADEEGGPLVELVVGLR